MPNPDEIAEIRVNGQIYTTWESVRVEISRAEFHTTAIFQAVESNDSDSSFQNLKIMIGDKCEVYLASQKILDGYVFQRQSSFNADTHAVMITAGSKTFDPGQCSAPLKTSHMAGYTFEAISRTVLSPYGVDINIQNPPSGYDRPFNDVNVNPGETAFEMVDRLARMRGMILFPDENGNIVAGLGDATAAPIADFQEGVNILASNCIVRNDQMFSNIDAVGQQRGSDEVNGDQSRASAAQSSNSSVTRYRNLTVLPEEPGSAEDAAARVQSENMFRAGNMINCQVTVQGWLKSDGTLWKLLDSHTITSPMHLLDNAKLMTEALLFEQSNGVGSTTTLTLVNPEALDNRGINADGNSNPSPVPGASPTSTGSSSPNSSSAPALPGGTPTTAQPVDPNATESI